MLARLLICFCALAVLCSAQVAITLKEDTLTSGQVTFDHWAYYRFVVPASRGFVIEVQHTTNTKHDLDVYIQKGGDLPTRLSGGYVYKDNGLSPNISIQGASERAETVYVVGIYGFKGDLTRFFILLTVTNGCPKNCSNRGVCFNNVCSCNSGYTGDACELSITRLVLNTNYTVNLQPSTWQFYMLQVARSNDISIIASQSQGDVDVYVRYGFVPTLVNYDYADTTRAFGSASFTLNVTSPLLGLWYIGFYSTQGTAARTTFRVVEQRACPMRCSNHGSCVGTRCQCNTGYTGNSCEERSTFIELNTTYSGYVDSNYWNFYKYSSNSMTPLVATLVSIDAGSDCDIYVRSDSKPTRWNFLFRNVSMKSTTELAIYDPGQRLWYIGIYGSTACNYTLNLVQRSAVGCGCVNGSCVNGRCVCNVGWAGDKCDQNTNTINGTLVNGVVSATQKIGNGQWAFYTIRVSGSSQLNVLVNETNTKGNVWLFVAASHSPTLSVFDATDQGTAGGVRRVMLEYAAPTTRTFYIGVYGSPFILAGEVDYKVVAWATPF